MQAYLEKMPRMQIRTFRPKILYTNKHIQPERKFSRCYKKTCMSRNTFPRMLQCFISNKISCIQ